MRRTDPGADYPQREEDRIMAKLAQFAGQIYQRTIGGVNWALLPADTGNRVAHGIMHSVVVKIVISSQAHDRDAYLRMARDVRENWGIYTNVQIAAPNEISVDPLPSEHIRVVITPSTGRDAELRDQLGNALRGGRPAILATVQPGVPSSEVVSKIKDKLRSLLTSRYQ